MNTQLNCARCATPLWTEGHIGDNIDLCHACYETATLAQQLGVTVKVRDGFSGEWPAWARQAWTVTALRNGTALRFGWYGGGMSSAPTAEDIVEDMRITAQLGSLSFEQYVAEIGANVDSVTDLKTYRRTRKLADRIIRWMGEDADILTAE